MLYSLKDRIYLLERQRKTMVTNWFTYICQLLSCLRERNENVINFCFDKVPFLHPNLENNHCILLTDQRFCVQKPLQDSFYDILKYAIYLLKTHRQYKF